MLYLFDVLGGLALGTIEASRMEQQSGQFTTAVKDHSQLIEITFTAALESELVSRGINVKRVKAPMAADERSIDYSRVEATTP
jgi:hypothetical protein